MPARQQLTAIVAIVMVLLAISDIQAQGKKKQVKLSKQWAGSVADEKLLQKDTPEFIGNAKAWESLWYSWKLEGKLPEIDFTKEIVILATSPGSKLNLSASLDDNGDLQILGFGTRDFGTGFRYVLGTVSREGVKTVNKKELPK